MKRKGIVAPAGYGYWYIAVQRFFLFPYKVVKDRNGNPVTFHFKQSAINYLWRYCNVCLEDIKEK